MKTITLPSGTESVRFDELAHLIALSMWPLRDDESGLNYGYSLVTIERELAQAAETNTIALKDPVTLGPYINHPGGARLEDALVRVDDLRMYVADRGLLVEVPELETIAPSPELADAEETEPVSPEFEKWRVLWRAVSFDEYYEYDDVKAMAKLPPKTISEIATRDEKLEQYRLKCAHIAGRKEWLVSQMSVDELTEVERRFTVEEMAESRHPPDALEKMLCQ